MKRSISLFLIIFLMIGQTGLTFATHYCGGSAVKTKLMLNNDLPDCGMNMMSSCEMTPSQDEGPLVKREPCCQDHMTKIEANQDLLTGFLESSETFTYEFSVTVEELPFVADQVEFIPLASSNSPPDSDHDLQVLFQSFLI
jgi:hypothetical protein